MNKNVYGKEVLDKAKHYVIIGTIDFIKDISNELKSFGFEDGVDFTFIYDLVCSADRRENGVFIGKLSGFPTYWERFMVDKNNGGTLRIADFIDSIGRFTSINNYALVQDDHNMKTISTAPFERLLSQSKRDYFR